MDQPVCEGYNQRPSGEGFANTAFSVDITSPGPFSRRLGGVARPSAPEKKFQQPTALTPTYE